jgi:hypothetical protein
MSRRDGNREIYVMNADGSGPQDLVAHEILDENYLRAGMLDGLKNEIKRFSRFGKKMSTSTE